MTWRQFLTWQQWHRLDLNRAGKLEWYLRLVACEIARIPSQIAAMWGGKGKPWEIQPSDERFSLSFGTPDAAGMTSEQKVLANPGLYDAPPVMTKELIAKMKVEMRRTQLKRQAAAQKKEKPLSASPS